MTEEFDTRDAEIMAERAAKRDAHDGPRVGDFVEFTDGTLGRFSYDRGDSMQWSVGECFNSFHLHKAGGVSFSGSLYASLPKAELEHIGERPGWFWIFHHGYVQAHSGVNGQVPCRVYRFKGPPRKY